MIPMPTFFEYDDTFVPWLMKYAERRMIVDVGCGRGHLVRALVQAGHDRTAGIDRRPVADPDIEARVLVADATTSRLCSASGLLLVIARPCHGDWIERMVRRAGSEVLYIGRSSKLVEDLGEEFAAKAVCLDAPGVRPALPMALDENEGEEIGVWSLRRPKAELRLWLVETRSGVGWVDRRTRLGPKGEDWTSEEQDGLGYWTSGLGAGSHVEARDTIIEGPVFFRTDIEVDWSRCDWVQRKREEAPEGPCGWISPWGAFYGCGYAEHDLHAYYVLGYEVQWLEELGWARAMSGGSSFRGAILASRHDDRDLTDAQVAVVVGLAAKHNLEIRG